MTAKEFIKEVDEKEGGAYWSDDQDLLPMYMEQYAELYHQSKVQNIYQNHEKCINKCGCCGEEMHPTYYCNTCDNDD